MAVDVTGRIDPIRAKRRKALGTVLVYGVLILLLIIIAAPVIFALIKSTTNFAASAAVSAHAYFRQECPGQLLGQPLIEYGLGRNMVNSGLIAAIGSSGKIVTSLLGALAFVYFDFPGKRFWFYFVLLTLMLPCR